MYTYTHIRTHTMTHTRLSPIHAPATGDIFLKKNCNAHFNTHFLMINMLYICIYRKNICDRIFSGKIQAHRWPKSAEIFCRNFCIYTPERILSEIFLEKICPGFQANPRSRKFHTPQGITPPHKCKYNTCNTHTHKPCRSLSQHTHRIHVNQREFQYMYTCRLHCTLHQ